MITTHTAITGGQIDDLLLDVEEPVRRKQDRPAEITCHTMDENGDTLLPPTSVGLTEIDLTYAETNHVELAEACPRPKDPVNKAAGDPARSGNRTVRPPVDMARAEAALRSLLLALGEDPDREGLIDTPRRVARMYRELFAGLSVDPAVHLSRVFHEQYDEIVLLKNIDFHSLCEHHLLPFHGRAHVAYLPAGRVVGLSKLARTVDAFARRPQVQERMTCQIADAIMRHLAPKGAAVVVEAEHMCMKMRGVQKPNGVMVTSAVRGVFKENAAARAEVMALIQSNGR